MGSVNASGNNQPLLNVQQAQQAAKPEASKDRQTLTEKFFEETEVGAFYEDSPWIAGVATGAGLLGVAGAGAKMEWLGELLFNEKTAGLIVGGAGGLLIEEGIDDLSQGKQMSGAIKSTLGGVAALGGAELLTGAKVLSKPAEIIFKNGFATGGTAVGVASTLMVKSGLNDIAEGDTGVGALKTAAGAVGGLGAVELVGRQFDKSLIVDPLVNLAKTKGAQYVGAGAGAVAGAGLAVDGARRLAQNGGVLNDALAVAEVSGGALLAAGSTSLAGLALGNATMTSALVKTAMPIGGAALVGTTYVLGKETIKNASENGLSYMNVATGTGAALSALGAAETFGMKSAFTGKAGQLVGAAGLGVASGLLAKGAYDSFQEGNTGEAALKGFGAVVGTGGAMALAGVPGVRQAGEKILKVSFENVIAPAAEFAFKNPVVSIPLAIGGAYAAYKLTGDKEDNAPTVEEVQAIGEQHKAAAAAAAAGTKIEE